MAEKTATCVWCGDPCYPDVDVCGTLCRKARLKSRDALEQLDTRQRTPTKGPGYSATDEHTAWARDWEVPGERGVCPTCEGRGSVTDYGSDPLSFIRRDRACPECQPKGPGVR